MIGWVLLCVRVCVLEKRKGLSRKRHRKERCDDNIGKSRGDSGGLSGKAREEEVSVVSE